MRSYSMLLVVFCILAFSGKVRAERIAFIGGGQLEAEILNPGESPRKIYEIRTEKGVRMKLDAKMVERVEAPEKKDILDYRRLAPFRPDTVENHLQIAEWCVKRYMSEIAKRHWMRAIELDPRNETAHTKLGHTKVNQEWIDPEKRYTDQGYVKTNGSWKLPQEVELEKILAKKSEIINKCRSEVRRLSLTLNDPSSKEAILSITDPVAVLPIAECLLKDQSPAARMLYLRALSNIGTPPAIGVIVQHSLDPNETAQEVRDICFELIRKHPHAVSDAGQQYSLLLRSPDNSKINFGAYAIGKIGARGAVRRLIDALITQHKRVEIIGSGKTNVGMSSGGSTEGTGFQQGQTKREVIDTVQNREVYKSLVKLTGVDFGYDRLSWIQWLESQSEAFQFDPRRG